MTQDEWLFRLANIKRKKKEEFYYYGSGYKGYIEVEHAESVQQLTNEERRKVIEKMENYWKEHRPSSSELLVNGAVVYCDQGSRASKVQGKGQASLTRSSYLCCPKHRGAYIKPITSGQEFAVSFTLFQYPKFVVETNRNIEYYNTQYWDRYCFYNVPVDLIIIRKLVTRNLTLFNVSAEQKNSKGYYEHKWLEYLAKFLQE